MQTVIPISQSDKHLIPQFLRGLDLNPPGAGQDALVIGWENVSGEVASIAAELQKHFGTVTTHTLAINNDHGWPIGGAWLFKEACYKVATICPNHGWLWLELDTCPLKVGWLTAIENAYYLDQTTAAKEGRPFNKYLGVREKTLESRGGELLPIDQAGTHMAPVGVYPGDIAAFVPVVNSLGANQRPFWQHIQWYANKSLNDSPLIQNNRSTINYTKDGCESNARNPWGVHWNNSIRNDAVLLHGVKDDSLIDLLTPWKVESGTAIHFDAPVIVQQVEPVAEVVPVVEPLKEGFQEFQDDLEEEQRAIIAPIVAPISTVEPLKSRKQTKPKRRSRMSPEAREAQGKRMSAMWETRRAAKAAKDAELVTV